MLIVLLAVGIGYYIGSKRCCNCCSFRQTNKNPKPHEGIDIDELAQNLAKITSKNKKGKKK